VQSLLSHGLEAQLRALVIEGDLAPGTRINEVHLARELNVSRTPLREALTRLVGESFLEAKPRRGFFVRRLLVDEMRDLYSIRARLDPWALSVSSPPSSARIAELRELNAKVIAATGNVTLVIELDDCWHLELLAGCRNQALLDLIRQMMWRTRRYEFAYLSSANNVAKAGEQHERILTALENGDVPGACEALEGNMTTAIEPLITWLTTQNQSEDQ